MNPSSPPHDQDERMNRVLTGLRMVQPPTGMNRRIFEALEAEIRPAQRRLPPLSLRTRAFLRVAGVRQVQASLAACTALLLVAALLHSTRTRPAVNPPETRLPSPTETAIATTPVPHRHTRRIRTSSRPSAEELLCLRELQAPSHPAPPLPLTAEEKLLLSIAHTGDPAEFAMLNPELHAKQEEESTADFQRFTHQAASASYPN